MNDDMKELLTDIKVMFDGLSQQITENIKDLSAVADDVTKIKMSLENDTNKNIQLLAEGHAGIVENMAQIKTEADKIPTLCEKVDLIEAIVTGTPKN